MGFWEKIFGKPAEQKKTLKLEELEEQLEKKLEKEKQAFLNESSGLLEQTSSLVTVSLERLKEIKERDFEAEGENKYLRKIVQSSKQGFASRMQALLEKTRPPQGKDFEKCFSYSSQAVESFRQEVVSFRKNIAYTGILAKQEMIDLGKNIQELETRLASLQALAKNSSISQSKQLLEKTGQVKTLIAEKNQTLEEEKKLKEMLASLEKEKSEVLEKSKGLKEGSAFKEFDEKTKEKEKLLEEKRLLREKALNLTAPLEKQLRRLQNLAEIKEFVLEKEQERILNSYLQDCFNALKQDVKGEELKELLAELEKAINSGKITFKDEKEKGKKLQALKELQRFDFFNEFFWKLNELDKKLSSIEQDLEKSTLFKELNALQARLESIEREASQKSKEMEASKEKAEKQAMVLSNETEKLQAKATELFQITTEIRL